MDRSPTDFKSVASAYSATSALEKLYFGELALVAKLTHSLVQLSVAAQRISVNALVVASTRSRGSGWGTSVIIADMIWSMYRKHLYRSLHPYAYLTIDKTMTMITVNDIPSHSMFVATRGFLYLLKAQAMRPPTQGWVTSKGESRGSNHQAQDTRSRDSISLFCAETSAPHSGQNTASLRIGAWQALQEYKGFEQYWQKLLSGVDLPHVGHFTVSAILGSRIQSNEVNVNRGYKPPRWTLGQRRCCWRILP